MGVGSALLMSLIFVPMAGGFENDVVQCVDIGPGDFNVPLDESFFTFPIPASNVQKMQNTPCYSGMPPSQIQSLIQNTRRCVVDVVGRIGREDQEAGDWWDFLFRTNGVCLGLGPAGYKPRCEIISDGQSGLTNAEKVNLYQACQSTYSPTQFESFQYYIDLTQCGFLGRQTCHTGTVRRPPKSRKSCNAISSRISSVWTWSTICRRSATRWRQPDRSRAVPVEPWRSMETP